ncbi:SHOCT domain-containing protein [Natrarchaeobaculum aegyptiacum]|uniref:SHOCT domain-containing protein n=1 Tax=Natrarchaeobaculum aegyptiacum TaxID=745377 RepID=A0A2Z2HU64_9EURY|nr:SHOCT domain-containing protein [Natrarchaeobaculum aegyptiacum]ARS89017.1 hypothetical protein B1756_04110 [Natrarchaeobaculum aegyptiacum]
METASDPGGRFRENLTEITALLVTGVWLALLLSPIGGSAWLVALLVGYLVVVPIVALLYGDELDRKEWWDDWVGDMLYWYDESDLEDDSDGVQTAQTAQTADSASDPTTREALETLRARYAGGELTDEQFERKLDRLLETETLEDAERWRRNAELERGSGEAASGPADARGRDDELDRNLERES